MPLKTWQSFFHGNDPHTFDKPLPKNADWEETITFDPKDLTQRTVHYGSGPLITTVHRTWQGKLNYLHSSRVNLPQHQINLMDEEEVKEKAEAKAKLQPSIRFVHKNRLTASELDRSTEHSIIIGVPQGPVVTFFYPDRDPNAKFRIDETSIDGEFYYVINRFEGVKTYVHPSRINRIDNGWQITTDPELLQTIHHADGASVTHFETHSVIHPPDSVNAQKQKPRTALKSAETKLKSHLGITQENILDEITAEQEATLSKPVQVEEELAGPSAFKPISFPNQPGYEIGTPNVEMDESLTQITTAEANSGVDESQILQGLQQTFEPTKEKFILQGQPVANPSQFTLTDMYASLTAPKTSQVPPTFGEKQVQDYENYSSDEDTEQVSSKPKDLTDFQVLPNMAPKIGPY